LSNCFSPQSAQHSTNGDICYDNLASVVQGSEAFEFLDDAIPQRISAEDAAAINLHLKLAQGVVIHPDKKASRIGVSCGTSCCFPASFLQRALLTRLRRPGWILADTSNLFLTRLCLCSD
jgi:hypothetical protein